MYKSRHLVLFALAWPIFLVHVSCSSSATGDDPNSTNDDHQTGGTDSNTDSNGIQDTDSLPACVITGEEICDGIDNNCDGVVDEGVFNDCGNCEETCYEAAIDPISDGEKGDGVVDIEGNDPENPTKRPGITLSKESKVIPYLWPANHEHQTVTKFDIDLVKEVGRYWTGDNPSRTAVDLNGNCWVGTRNDGRVTKIISDKSKCTDRDLPGVRPLNGVIDTSEPDVNGNIAVLNSAAHPLADECVAYSAVPNPSRPSIRGLAVAPDGKIWIGYSSGGIQSIDPETLELGPFYDGSAVPLWVANPTTGVLEDSGKTANTGGVYGLVIDSRGRLYQASYTRNYLPCFDTMHEKWIAIYQRGGACAYGITVDSKNRIWTGSYPDCTGVGMFDPNEKKFYSFGLPQEADWAPMGTSSALLVANGGVGGKSDARTTGVAVEPKSGDIWTSFFQAGYTGRLQLNEADYTKSSWTLIGTLFKEDGSGLIDGIGSRDLRGVGFDYKGYAWTLGLNSDRLFKLDPATNQRHPDTPVGISAGVGPHYTYSDFTGSTVFNFTAPRGEWDYIAEKPFQCAVPIAIDWEAYVPEGTTAGIRIGALDANDQLIGPWVPNMSQHGQSYFQYPQGAPNHHIDLHGDVDNLKGEKIKLNLLMTTMDREVRPIIHSIDIEWDYVGADLAIELRTIDGGPCPAALVETQLTNLGSEPATNILVRYYAGDPNQGGTLVHETIVPGPLAPQGGTLVFQELIEDFTQKTAITVFGVVDPDNAILECNEDNNMDSANNDFACTPAI